MTRVMIIIGSVRPGRIGLPIAQWVTSRVEAAGHEVDMVDLVELGLPFLDEPAHPAKQQYEHEHTRAWSARVAQADAVIFVSPEYNHSYSPAMKNAVDFLYNEWLAKPIAFVSYGGTSGGSRGVMAMEPVMSTVGAVKIPTNIEMPFGGKQISDGTFAADERQTGGVDALIEQLVSYADALRPLQKRVG